MIVQGQPWSLPITLPSPVPATARVYFTRALRPDDAGIDIALTPVQAQSATGVVNLTPVQTAAMSEGVWHWAVRTSDGSTSEFGRGTVVVMR